MPPDADPVALAAKEVGESEAVESASCPRLFRSIVAIEIEKRAPQPKPKIFIGCAYPQLEIDEVHIEVINSEDKEEVDF